MPAELIQRAEPGESLSEPNDATALSLRFLEWQFLTGWARAELDGEPPHADGQETRSESRPHSRRRLGR